MKLALALALFAVGCGDDGTTTVDAAPSATKVADAAIDGAPAGKEGQVFIAEAHDPIEIATAFAMMFDGPLISPTATADECLTMPNTPGSSLSAGSITVAGTTTPLTLAQDAPGDVYTPAVEPPSDLFAAGATLTAAATGGVVPAFSGSVVAPAPLANVAFPASLSRAAPATVTWTAGSGSTVWIFVNSATTTEGALLCRTTDDGTFTLTPAALALLPAALTQVTIVAYRINETTTTAGAWTIYVRAVDLRTSGQLAIGS